MNGDQKAWSLAMFMFCIALMVCIGIMARCSVLVDSAQIQAAECTKHGGTWHVSADPTVQFCEEAKK